MLSLLFASILIGAGEKGPLTLETLPTEAAALAESTRVELKIATEGKPVTYTGVPLAAVLARRAAPVEGMPGLRELSDAVLLVRGEDGYQTAVSAAAVAMDPRGERYLLATAVDGQARKPQLIIPNDPRRTRWVREVKSIRLARLGQLGESAP